MVMLPDRRLEPLAGRIRDSNVREEVVPVIGNQGVSELDPKGVRRDGGEDVVAKGSTTPVGCPGGVIEEGL